MKLAVIVVKFPSGYVAEAGEDSAAIKATFKEIKGRGYLVRGEEVAEAVYFFSTTGEIVRKFLRAPDAAEAVAASKAAGLAQIEGAAVKRAESEAAATGADQARATADAAVRLIAAAVTAVPKDPAAALRDLDRLTAHLASAEAEIARLNRLLDARPVLTATGATSEGAPDYAPEGFKCATFDPAAQEAISPEVRAKMDADRARSQTPLAPAPAPVAPVVAKAEPPPTAAPEQAAPAPDSAADDSADPEERFGGGRKRGSGAAKR